MKFMRRFASAALHNSLNNWPISGWLELRISWIAADVAKDELPRPSMNNRADPTMDGRNTRIVNPRASNHTRVTTLRLNSNADQNSSFLSTTSGTPKVQAMIKYIPGSAQQQNPSVLNNPPTTPANKSCTKATLNPAKTSPTAAGWPRMRRMKTRYN